MFRIPPPPPLDARVEADRPITPDLLAAASGLPRERADPFLSAWLACARSVAVMGLVVVFDEFVIGRPDPLLLEAVDHLRAVRRAAHLGHFDDWESADDHWCDVCAGEDCRCDDLDVGGDPPMLCDRVLDAMSVGQESNRLLDGIRFDSLVWSVILAEPGELLDLARLALPLRRMLTELADAIRIGEAVVVDSRLLGERADGLRWAA